MGKLLAISYFMPPLLSPRSLQVSRTLKYIARLGWESTVLTVDSTSLRPGQHFLDPTLESTYRGCFRMVQARSPESMLLLLALRKAFSKIHVPGGRALWAGRLFWAPAAITAGRRLLAREGSFSAIASFAMPWSSHIVARALQQASGLPWVAHFSDPWLDSPGFRGGPLSRWLVRRVEESIVRDADLVVFVSQRTADLVMRKYPPDWRRKTCVVRHGYDAETAPTLRVKREPAAKLRLVHAGHFYTRRTPKTLLMALEKLNRGSPLRAELEVIFVGSNQPSYQSMSENLGLGEVVLFAGPRPHLEALQAIALADVCLLIEAPSDRESVFLPCKVVDYMMLRKPILGITPRAGESADLLLRMGCPVVAPDDVSGTADAIHGLLRAWRSNRLAVSPEYERVASEFDARNTSRLFDNALREARARSRG